MLSGVWVCICVPQTTLRNVCSEKSFKVRVYKLSPNHYITSASDFCSVWDSVDTVTACCQLALVIGAPVG